MLPIAIFRVGTRQLVPLASEPPRCEESNRGALPPDDGGGGQGVLVDELADGLEQVFITDVHESNDPLRVEDVDRRIAGDVPRRGNGPAPAGVRPRIPPGAIAQGFLSLSLFHDGWARSGLDAQDGERPILVKILHQPFVGIERPADTAPLRGKEEHDDLTAVVAEAERLAIQVSSRDVWCDLPWEKGRDHATDAGNRCAVGRSRDRQGVEVGA